MNKKICLFLFTYLTVVAVRGQGIPAEQLARKLAQRMVDSVGVTVEQSGKIYEINMELFRRKSQARQRYAGNIDSLAQQVQYIENQRDYLYKQVIASDEKYQMYKSKKTNIIRAN